MARLKRHAAIDEDEDGGIVPSDKLKAAIFDMDGHLVGIVTASERNSAIQFFEEDHDYLPTLLYDKRRDEFHITGELGPGEVMKNILEAVLDTSGYVHKIVKSSPSTFKKILEAGKRLERKGIPAEKFMNYMSEEETDPE